MKITPSELIEMSRKLVKRADETQGDAKEKLISALEALRVAAQKAEEQGASEIDIEIEKLDVTMFDAQEAAERTSTGGIASNVESELTKQQIENLRDGCDLEGFPDDMNNSDYRDNKPVTANFGRDAWLQG